METGTILPIDRIHRIGIPEENMWCKTGVNCGIVKLPMLPRDPDPVTGEPINTPIVREVDQTEAPTSKPAVQKAEFPLVPALAILAAIYFLGK